MHDSIHPEDLDTDGEDHALDECRYALMSRPISPDLPKPTPSKSEDFWNRVKRDINIHNHKDEDSHEITEDDVHVV